MPFLIGTKRAVLTKNPVIVAAGAIPFTWNPADAGTNSVFANSNRDYLAASTGSWVSCRSTDSKSAGKWYVEITIPSAVTASTPNAGIGLANSNFVLTSYLGSTSTSTGNLFAFAGSIFNSSDMVNVTNPPNTDTVTAGDIYQEWWDLDAGKVWLGKNGSPFAGMSPSAGTGPWVTWTPAGQSWFVAATQNSNSTCTLRLPATTTYSPGAGFSVLNA